MSFLSFFLVHIIANDKDSTPIKCSKDEYLVQNDNRVVSNGCSKPSFISIDGEEDFTYCCDRHDACYSVCGASKDFCDRDFGKCMTSMCKSVYKHNNQCSTAANMYMMGTSMFGQLGFDETQVDFCTCISVDKVPEHTKRLVEQFYKNYTAHETIDVDSLVRKYATNSGTLSHPRFPKLYKLYYELHKKYDKAISRTYAAKNEEL